VRLTGIVVAALLLGSPIATLPAQPAQAQAETQLRPLCEALDDWLHDPQGAVTATLIVIGHNQSDEGATWARENAQRVANNVVYDYVRSRAEKDLNLADAEQTLTDAITAAVQGSADEQRAARQRLGRALSVELSAFMARTDPS
jgi:hypothetical protein